MFFSKNSSSCHTLNSDRGLNRIEQVLWRVFNRVNNYYSVGRKQGFDEPYRVTFSESDFHWLEESSSPSRCLVDSIWRKLPWEALAESLGELHICDIGCGRGHYALKMMESSRGMVSSYVGIDIVQNKCWDDVGQAGKIDFLQADSHEVCASIPLKCNVLVSNAAIEHFEYDIQFFKELKNVVENASRPIVQIHTLPSESCLPIYGLHGVRQYNSRTVRKLVDVFDSCTTAQLFYLGGDACNRVHMEYICGPKGDVRKERMEEYRQMRDEALRKNMMSPDMHAASFYCLIMQHRANIRFFG